MPPPLLLVPRWGREEQQPPRQAFKLLARTAAAAQELLRVGVGVALSVHHLQLAVGHHKAAGECGCETCKVALIGCEMCCSG